MVGNVAREDSSNINENYGSLLITCENPEFPRDIDSIVACWRKSCIQTLASQNSAAKIATRTLSCTKLVSPNQPTCKLATQNVSQTNAVSRLLDLPNLTAIIF